MLSNTCKALVCGAAIALLPMPAAAQDTTTTNDVQLNDTATANNNQPTYDRTVTTTQHEDKDFPWGLLGLLGLGGLLGRKRRDDAPDINVDARNRTRP